uniref:tRNA/rRNA methyltransferase SpoU type domain-containing protein n=1 Tax=Spumella elongata TaxID=89044 RepID=A0A7S3M9W2_9STRA
MENKEACGCGPAQALWQAPLAKHPKVAFLAGGEDVGLSERILDLCHLQCFIPGAECPLALGADLRRDLGQVGYNPTLNLAHAVVIALYERHRQLACFGAGSTTDAPK